MQKSAPRPSVRATATRPNRRPLGCNSDARALAAPAIYPSQSTATLERPVREIEVDFAPVTTRLEHKQKNKVYESAKTKVTGRTNSYLKNTSSFMQKMERHDSQ